MALRWRASGGRDGRTTQVGAGGPVVVRLIVQVIIRR